jgi:hypothetical protein
MSVPNLRFQPLWPPRTGFNPPPDAAPMRPEILHLNGSHLVWRDTQRLTPEAPRRPVTWDIRFTNESLVLHADLDRQGDLRPVDFREVRGRLNEVLVPENDLDILLRYHRDRLRQSLHWQRKLAACDPHMPAPEYDEEAGAWTFSTSRSSGDPIRGNPLDLPVLRPATNEIMADRREERLWIAYRSRLRHWAESLGFDTGLPMRHQICRARVFHYWPIRECRELFTSAPPFAAVFGALGLVPELDDPTDDHWRETATRLARLPRREWMERLGLPPTRQTARLFARLEPYLVATELPLIRQVFADPAARQLLSDITTRIPDYLLRYFLLKPLPLRWSLVRQLCRARSHPHWVISSAMWQMDFFRNEPLIGPRLLKLYRRARSHDDIHEASMTAAWFRAHWKGLFQPDVRDAVSRTRPPLTGTDTIRHLNRPQELIELSIHHNLCLEKYIDPIIRGEYALYRLDHEGHFAVAGIKRAENSTWELDEIRGAKNAEPPAEVKGSFHQWLTECSIIRKTMPTISLP